MWSGAPFVWQIYAQADGAHAPKLDALLDHLTAGCAPELAASLRLLWRAWNGLGGWPSSLPPADAWRRLCRAWRGRLAEQADLGSQLLRFVDARR
jgi:hypothetical protein